MLSVHQPITPGMLEVIYGAMFGGKSLNLIRRIEQLKYKNISYKAFKPLIDDRNGAFITSRFTNVTHPATYIETENPYQILDKINPKKDEVAIIDEGQFFTKEFSTVVAALQSADIYVIVAGLNLDFTGEPYGEIPNLMARADYLHAAFGECNIEDCDQTGTRTQRITWQEGEYKPAPYNDDLNVIEHPNNNSRKAIYEARCPKHHIVPGKPLDSIVEKVFHNVQI